MLEPWNTQSISSAYTETLRNCYSPFLHGLHLCKQTNSFREYHTPYFVAIAVLSERMYSRFSFEIIEVLVANV